MVHPSYVAFLSGTTRPLTSRPGSCPSGLFPSQNHGSGLSVPGYRHPPSPSGTMSNRHPVHICMLSVIGSSFLVIRHVGEISRAPEDAVSLDVKRPRHEGMRPLPALGAHRPGRDFLAV